MRNWVKRFLNVYIIYIDRFIGKKRYQSLMKSIQQLNTGSSFRKKTKMFWKIRLFKKRWLSIFKETICSKDLQKLLVSEIFTVLFLITTEEKSKGRLYEKNYEFVMCIYLKYVNKKYFCIKYQITKKILISKIINVFKKLFSSKII